MISSVHNDVYKGKEYDSCRKQLIVEHQKLLEVTNWGCMKTVHLLEIMVAVNCDSGGGGYRQLRAVSVASLCLL